ncbi:MAG: hypothetical protein ACFFD2_19995, partial [Promethearchaeota archaeon]
HGLFGLKGIAKSQKKDLHRREYSVNETSSPTQIGLLRRSVPLKVIACYIYINIFFRIVNIDFYFSQMRATILLCDFKCYIFQLFNKWIVFLL